MFDGDDEERSRHRQVNVNPLTETYGALARSLWDAEHQAMPIDRINIVIPCLSVADGYAIRREVDLLRMIDGAVPVGRKVGLATRSALVRNSLDEPFWSYIFSSGEQSEGGTINLRRYVQPKIEAEVAFVLAEDLDDPELTPEAAFTAVHSLRPAIEIIDVRTGNWDASAAESIADSGLNAGFMLGESLPNDGRIDPNAITARIRTDRRGDTGPIGRTSDLLGGPLGILAWLARSLVASGEPLRAGEVVLTGTLTPPVTLEPGRSYTAEFAGFGEALGIVRLVTR
jgi:2-keto-4-pentenoate hydratase